MSQAALAEFFFTGHGSVRQLQMLEFYHPSFSQIYRVCRNCYSSGITVTHTADTIEWVFEETSNEILAGDTLDRDTNQPWTASAWVKFPPGGEGDIISKFDDTINRGWKFQVLGGDLELRHANNNLTLGADRIAVGCSASSILDDDWHHVAASYDGSVAAAGVVLYIDGVSQSVATLPSGDTLTGTTVNGADFAAGPFTLNTTIAHPAVWLEELTPTHIGEIFTAGRLSPNLNNLATTPDPVLWWKLNEEDNNIPGGIEDYSGNGRPGTPNFAPSGVPGIVDYEYYPMQIKSLGASSSLDQSIEVTFGDLGEILATEIDRVASRNGFNIKPLMTYREYRSDDLSQELYGPFTLEISNISFNRTGAVFTAKPKSFSRPRVGEVYNPGRFPMLKSLT